MAKQQAVKPKKRKSRDTTLPIALPFRSSYTQLSTFQRCKTMYYWKYGLGLERMTPGDGLIRGDLLHQAYDAYMFGERKSHDIAHDVVDKRAQERIDEGVDPGVVNTVVDEAHEVLTHYLPWADKNDDWSVIVLPKATKCEVSGQIELKMPRKDDTPLLKPFAFKIDALVERNGVLMMLENKFRKTLDASGLEHDMQILAYQAAWNSLYPEHRIQGVIYNIVSAKPRAKDNAICTREYFYRGETEEKVALGLIRGIMREMEMQSELGVWPMSPRKECNWDCDFVGMCMGVRTGSSVEEYVDMGQYRMRDRSADRAADETAIPLPLAGDTAAEKPKRKAKASKK